MARTNAQKIRVHRERKRAAGYRLLQRWVVDTRDPDFLRRLDDALLRQRTSPEEAVLDKVGDLLAIEAWDDGG